MWNIKVNNKNSKENQKFFEIFLRAQIIHEQLFYESANRNDQKTIRKSFYSMKNKKKRILII